MVQYRTKFDVIMHVPLLCTLLIEPIQLEFSSPLQITDIELIKIEPNVRTQKLLCTLIWINFIGVDSK